MNNKNPGDLLLFSEEDDESWWDVFNSPYDERGHRTDSSDFPIMLIIAAMITDASLPSSCRGAHDLLVVNAGCVGWTRTAVAPIMRVKNAR